MTAAAWRDNLIASVGRLREHQLNGSGERDMTDRLRLSFGIVAAAAFIVACGGEKKPAGDTGQVAAATTAVDGAQIYQRCQTCHQATGEGIPGTYPPLAGSEFANAANVEIPIRIVMNGISGPITVKGQQFSGLMPPYGVGIEMSNEEIAAVLTYVRSSWGNKSSAVTPDDVAKVKATPRTATGSMTEPELKALMK